MLRLDLALSRSNINQIHASGRRNYSFCLSDFHYHPLQPQTPFQPEDKLNQPHHPIIIYDLVDYTIKPPLRDTACKICGMYNEVRIANTIKGNRVEPAH
jgi:hypothetical protein